MSAKRKPVPTNAQAELLARLISFDHKTVEVGGYNSPTELVLLKHGWIQPSGVNGEHPNGRPYKVHVISEAGYDAMERWLFERRCKKIAAGEREHSP